MCSRCGFLSDRKSTLSNHFNKKHLCPLRHHDYAYAYMLQELSDINLRNYKKTCEKCQQTFTTLTSFVRHCTNNECTINTNPSTDEHLLNVASSFECEIKVIESVYKKTIENHFKATHKKLKCGMTDISTSQFHLEIKHWTNWKMGVGSW